MTGQAADPLQAYLEDSVDGLGLAEVLNTLADVCNAKADHLQSAWQDEASSKAWARAALRIRSAAEAEAVRTVQRCFGKR